MNSPLFQLGKVKLALVRSGAHFLFQRDNLDEYNEPDGTQSTVVNLKGLYHETQGYITTTKGDASAVRSKPAPQILALWDEAKLLEQGDYTVINGAKYLVTGVHDLSNANLIADISLEVVV